MNGVKEKILQYWVACDLLSIYLDINEHIQYLLAPALYLLVDFQLFITMEPPIFALLCFLYGSVIYHYVALGGSNHG